MGRSVSTPSNTAAVAYTHFEGEDADDFVLEVLDGFRYSVKRAFPSATGCNVWLGREDHAIMENGHAYFGVSEYCGLVAYWIVPKDGALAEAWCARAAAKFEATFGTMVKTGHASNGEAFFVGKE